MRAFELHRDEILANESVIAVGQALDEAGHPVFSVLARSPNPQNLSSAYGGFGVSVRYAEL